ncbi:MAG: hypothetical protein ABI682_06480 [Acidobacteriota bacterium]
MKTVLSAVAVLTLFVSCQSSGPVTRTGDGSSGGTTVRGAGTTGEPAPPYGLPRETPIGGDRANPTPSPLPSNIPPTPHA